MKVLNEPVSIDELKVTAANTFGDLVKAVVDMDSTKSMSIQHKQLASGRWARFSFLE